MALDKRDQAYWDWYNQLGPADRYFEDIAIFGPGRPLRTVLDWAVATLVVCWSLIWAAVAIGSLVQIGVGGVPAFLVCSALSAGGVFVLRNP